MKKNSPIIVLLALIIVVVAGGFYFLKGSGGSDNGLMGFREVTLPNDAAATAATTTDSTPIVEPKALADSVPSTTQVTADMRGYQNSQFHFGLLFPKNLSAHQYDESGGALTVTFKDDATGESFQIYVTPYAGGQITTERFKMDEPSGVYLQPTDIIVDNTKATMFFSKNSIMGDVREVWFIRNGFLYEVTTYKELDTWLAGIIKTWKFL